MHDISQYRARQSVNNHLEVSRAAFQNSLFDSNNLHAEVMSSSAPSSQAPSAEVEEQYESALSILKRTSACS